MKSYPFFFFSLLALCLCACNTSVPDYGKSEDPVFRIVQDTLRLSAGQILWRLWTGVAKSRPCLLAQLLSRPPVSPRLTSLRSSSLTPALSSSCPPTDNPLFPRFPFPPSPLPAHPLPASSSLSSRLFLSPSSPPTHSLSVSTSLSSRRQLTHCQSLPLSSPASSSLPPRRQLAHCQSLVLFPPADLLFVCPEYPLPVVILSAGFFSASSMPFGALFRNLALPSRWQLRQKDGKKTAKGRQKDGKKTGRFRGSGHTAICPQRHFSRCAKLLFFCIMKRFLQLFLQVSFLFRNFARFLEYIILVHG